MRFKFCKPLWAKRKLQGGQPNPDFKQDIEGEDNLEGEFDQTFIDEMNKRGFNVYYFPNYPSKMPEGVKYANGRHIDVFKYVFVDMDLKDGKYASKEEFYQELKSFSIRPYLVVDSGNGVHAYWKVKDLTRDQFPIIQKLLIKRFNTDNSIWTLKQIMRYPGTKNTKNINVFKSAEVVEPFETSKKTVSVSELLAVLPEVTEDIKKAAKSHIDKIDGKLEESIQEIDFDHIPERFLDDTEKDSNLRNLFEKPKSYKGDRSTADFKLCQELMKRGYSKREALSVIVNTEKSRSRDSINRTQYANDIVNKIYTEDISIDEIKPVSEIEIKSNDDDSTRVWGPDWIDVLSRGWRLKEVMGLVFGTGVGKTSFSLQLVKDMLENPANQDRVVVMFSLEMTAEAVKNRWDKLVVNNPKLSERFYIIDTMTSDNDIRNIGLQEIVWYTQKIEESSKKKVMTIVIDYMSELGRTVDIRKKPNFNVEGSGLEKNASKGPIKTLTYEALCLKVKDIAKITNSFVIMQSQTTKELDGDGSRPLGKHSAFGTSNFANMVHYMVTGWQPLMNVYNETNLRVTAFQYCKIREVTDEDEVKINSPQNILFDVKSGQYRVMNSDETREFNCMLNIVRDREENENKKKASGVRYQSAKNVKRYKLLPKSDKNRNNG